MPAITITSDFNSQMHSIARLKNICLHKWKQQLTIIDVTHHISPFSLPEAAYICSSSLLDFPENFFHIILVDIFDQNPTHFLIAQHNNQFYICANNGILPMTMLGKKDVNYFQFEIIQDENNHILLNIFQSIVNAIDSLEKNSYNTKLLQKVDQLIEKLAIKPRLKTDCIEAQVLSIDSFENVVLNITQSQLIEYAKGRSFKIELLKGEVIEHISKNYSDVEEGEKLAFFNEAGFLEIAINKGNAAGLLGIRGRGGDKSYQQPRDSVMYNTIKIHFN